MAIITPEKLQRLKNEAGMTDQQIISYAQIKGHTLPDGFEVQASPKVAPTMTAKRKGKLRKFGSRLIQSETRFGESIAGAIGGDRASRKVEKAQVERSGIAERIIQRIKENQASGKDTSKLIDALRKLKEEGIVTSADITPSIEKTGKQVFGEALGVLTDVVGAGALPGVAGAVTKGGATALKGLKVGSITGAAFGGSSGFAIALQEDKTLKEAAKEGLTGAALGAVIGGAIGGATGKLSQFIQNRKAARQLISASIGQIDNIDGKVTKNLQKEALKVVSFSEKQLKAKGRIQALEGGLGKTKRKFLPRGFQKLEILSNKEEKELADSLAGFVRKKYSPDKNIDALRSGIGELSDVIDNGLKGKNAIFNEKQLISKLKNVKADAKLQAIFATDRSLEKVFDDFTKVILREVKGQGHNNLGLLQARKNFDKVINEAIGAFKGDPGSNIKKNMALQLRRAMNDFISDNLPGGEVAENLLLKEALKKQHLMFRGITRIAEKAQTTAGKSAAGNAMKRLLQMLGAGLIGSAGVGALSTLRKN